MAPIIRVKLRWSGFVGSPGYSVFHFADWTGSEQASEVTQAMAQAAAVRVRDFINETRWQFPAVVTFSVENDVEVIDDVTGNLLDIRTVSGLADVLGGAGSAVGYSAPVGAVINWRTSVVRKNRRIRGRTFLVPLSGACFESNGTLNASTLTAFNTAAQVMLTSAADKPEFGVYARPVYVKNPDGSKTRTEDGDWAIASSYNVPDMGAVLRSRRD